jgi:hypothetical protein
MFRHIIPSPEGSGYYRTQIDVGGFAYRPSMYFNVEIRIYAVVTLLRHPIAIIAGAGILTGLPSASPFGYT